MCEPMSTTMMVATIASTVLAAGVSAYGQYEQGQQAKATAEYNARVNQNEAQKTLTQARIMETEERQKASEMRSKQRAALAAQGVVVDEGSALQIQDDTTRIGEANVLRIRQNAEERAEALREESKLNLAQGNNAASQGMLGAVGTGIKGLGSAAKTAYDGGLFAGKGDSTLLTGEGAGSVSEKWYTDVDSSKINLGTPKLTANPFKFS